VSGELLTPGEVLAMLRESFVSNIADGGQEPGLRVLPSLAKRTAREDATQQVVVTI
jgi:hypothetical protein